LITDERSRAALEGTESLVDPELADPQLRRDGVNFRETDDAALDAECGNQHNRQAARTVAYLVQECDDASPDRSLGSSLIDDIADGVLHAIWAETTHNPTLREREFHSVRIPPRGKKPPAILAREMAVQCQLLRDIFGNPFRPVAFDAVWRSDAAVSLARAMYDSRDFGNMPILADALEDAGCDSDDVLNHCRDPQQVHVRGCWVVDLVLGKE
jgi:hypothetical protein